MTYLTGKCPLQTNWHRDEGNSSGVFVHPLITTNVKLIVAVGEQHGGLEGSTVLPGTHRVHDMPASCISEIEDSHQRTFVGDAGDALLFDTKTWHTVKPNLSGSFREYFIIRFSPHTMRQAGLLTQAIERLRARGGLDDATPLLRSLLGVPDGVRGKIFPNVLSGGGSMGANSGAGPSNRETAL